MQKLRYRQNCQYEATRCVTKTPVLYIEPQCCQPTVAAVYGFYSVLAMLLRKDRQFRHEIVKKYSVNSIKFTLLWKNVWFNFSSSSYVKIRRKVFFLMSQKCQNDRFRHKSHLDAYQRLIRGIWQMYNSITVKSSDSLDQIQWSPLFSCCVSRFALIETVQCSFLLILELFNVHSSNPSILTKMLSLQFHGIVVPTIELKY